MLRSRRIGGAAAVARAVLRRGPVILAYHSVGESPMADDPEHLRVPPERFRAQLQLLRDAGGRFVTVGELAAALADGGTGRGLVAVTFDDGYHDNLAIALPIMRDLDARGTVFVATGLLGRASPWMSPGAGVRMLTEPEVRELAAAGVELGGHTVSHPDLTTVDRATCVREIAEGKTELERIAGGAVTVFAYPYFRYDAVAREVVERSGYATAVAGLGGGSLDDRLALPRSLVTGKDGIPTFVLRIAGIYDPLFRSWLGTAVRTVSRPARRLARTAAERTR